MIGTLGFIGFGLDPMTNPAAPPLDGKNYVWSGGRWVEAGAPAPAPVPGISFGKATGEGTFGCAELKAKIERHRASGSSLALIRALEAQLPALCAPRPFVSRDALPPPMPAPEVVPIQLPPPLPTPPIPIRDSFPLDMTRTRAEGDGPPLAMIAAGIVGVGVAAFVGFQVLTKKRRAA